MNDTLPSVSAFAAITVLGLTTGSQAAVLAQYNFTGGSGVASTVATDVAAGAYTPTGDVPATVGLSGAGNAFVRANNTKTTEALALTDLGTPAGDYHQVTISAGSGKSLDLTSLTFFLGHTTDNATSFTSTAVLTSSVNGFGTAITGTGGISRTTAAITGSAFNATEATFDLSAPAYQGLSTITFRLTTFDNLNDNGKLTRIDDFTLNGTVTAVPEPSAALLGSLGLLALLRRRRH